MTHFKNSSDTNDYLLQNQPVGYVMVILTVAFIMLYLPCAIVLWQREQLKNSCYKIMACMAVLDIGSLFTGGTLPGIVSIMGSKKSILISYVNKVWGFSIGIAWIGYGALAIVLAINRCIHLKSEIIANDWFGGKKIYYWFAGCAIHTMLITGLLLTPLASLPYNPTYCVFVFEGLAGTTFSIHNWGISILLPIIHMFQYYYLRWRMSASSNQQQLNIYERQLVYQGALICMSIALCAITYVTLPRFVNANYIWVVQLFWFWAQGGNAIIYLTLNKTIRRKVANMFGVSIGMNSVVPITTVQSNF